MDDRKQGGEELYTETHKPKGPLATREEEILEFWNTEKIFERSLEKVAPKGQYVFYDGPPFATGLPHYGHLLQSALKDAVPRYRTMQGYKVERRWGWDCHGLPLENIIEQELGLKTKRDIEQLGIATFNEAARTAVMRYADEWRRIISRFGRWADMENDYKTMDASYTESVWWAFKNLYNRGLVYEGFKSMHFCPRCGTTLSNFEVAQGYKDIDDLAVTVKLPLVDEPDTSLLIWTTTAWTLPGNAAAAVNPQALYVTVAQGGEKFIVAKERVTSVFENAEVVKEFPGKELIGKKYLPPFDYFATELHKHKTHAWKVYGADFVTMDSGTGIVHIAPAFGADDLALAQKHKIPLIQHVTEEGKFIATVRDFAGLLVKPKGNPRETDQKVSATLAERKLLFKEEKIKHSYPHCWRCDTPLLNWAATSWFVKVSTLKQKLLAENKKVSWVPEHVGTGRFMNGLQSAPDWAISRSRYWGAPLPVWRHSKTKDIQVVGSVEELLSLVRKSSNKYFLMRHGRAHSNTEGILDSSGNPKNHLTEEGRKGVTQSAEALAKEKIDLIITSPMLRTRETAEIVRKELDLPESAVMQDERLHERMLGGYDKATLEEWKGAFKTFADEFTHEPRGCETFTTLRRRVGEFLFEIERRYTGKKILIVTHGDPAWVLEHLAKGTSNAELAKLPDSGNYFKNAEVREVPFTPYPHNPSYELDLHRPYIDEVPMGDSLSGEWKRVPDVFDCWFESGSMPFASNHYPFKKQAFNPKGFLGFSTKGYPAHFIAESIDQTRGWFYSLLVLGVGLFGKSPYKAVVTNGLILASDGRKMSKKLKNYPDPMEVVEKYGADALRYYLLSSSVIRGEDLRFKEQGVDEVSKKLLMRLDNVRSFYDLYADGTTRSSVSTNPLDKWILSRLGELVRDTTLGFESYEFDAATRPLSGFIDDLSTWYLRRSRDRFKETGQSRTEALATLREVLYVVAHVMAPVMPFFADDLYRRVREEKEVASVHLCDWPAAAAIDESLITEMAEVRLLASKGLEMRERAGLKVRQPLASFSAVMSVSSSSLTAILADELNVKEVRKLKEGESVLDTALTTELREEGTLRELTRLVQDMRKKEKYQVSDRPLLEVSTNVSGQQFMEKWRDAITEETGLSGLRFTPFSGEDGGVPELPFPATLILRR